MNIASHPLISGVRLLAGSLVIAIGSLLSGCMFHTCVAHGSFVATPEGERAIESLRVGDTVLTRATSHVASDRAIGTVTHVRDATAPHTLRLTLADGATLTVTGEHPVATQPTAPQTDSNGAQSCDVVFVPAKQLAGGMTVHTQHGVQKLVSIERTGKATVRDISVWPGETFYANGVLVHNKRFALANIYTNEQLAGSWTYIDEQGSVSSPIEISPTGDVIFLGSHGTLPPFVAGRDDRSMKPIKFDVALTPRAGEKGPQRLQLHRAYFGDTMPATIHFGDETVRQVKLARVSYGMSGQ